MHLSAAAVGILGGAGVSGLINPRVGFALMLLEVTALVLMLHFDLIHIQP